jgi:hypothetical protein
MEISQGGGIFRTANIPMVQMMIEPLRKLTNKSSKVLG